jgi:hypothetical protein
VANVVTIDAEDGEDEDLYTQSTETQNLARPESGCYVIYTSGK